MGKRDLVRAPARLAALLIAAACASPLMATPAVTLTGGSVSGNSGSFDVHLSNPGGSDQIGGYTVSFRVTPETGATGLPSVTSASNPSNSPTFNDAGQNPVLGTGSSGYYTVNDIYNTNPPGYIVGGDNTNLVHLNFSIPNGTSGKFDITLLSATAGNVPGSELDNSSGQAIPATFSSTPLVVSTPEPASFAAVLVAGSILTLRRRRSALSA